MDSTGIRTEGVTLDWLAFTLPVEGGLETVADLFGLGKERSRGIRGYSHAATLPCGGVVGWHVTRPEQGVHVELTSENLTQAAALDGRLADVHGFLRYLLALGAKMSRLDLALDDRDGLLDYACIQRSVIELIFTSRWRIVDERRRLVGGRGRTLYFGDRESKSFLRIYDKQAQQIDLGKADPGHWMRVELELKDEKAQAVATQYAQTGKPFVAGLLRGLLDFKEATENENKSRWPTASWWAELLQRAEKVRLSMPKTEPSMERTWNWMGKQWPRTLARALAADEGDLERLLRLADEGIPKLTAWDHALIDAYKRGRCTEAP